MALAGVVIFAIQALSAPAPEGVASVEVRENADHFVIVFDPSKRWFGLDARSRAVTIEEPESKGSPGFDAVESIEYDAQGRAITLVWRQSSGLQTKRWGGVDAETWRRLKAWASERLPSQLPLREIDSRSAPVSPTS